ncbi:hypothetical protein H5410_050771 [Solanum commersonii]|uniref:Uncharacterized protein n=1 Tax=Solanum commersonii TaxID=4109 RepID=A0A9J5WYZ1_SOLCO|nr:hypothetical protein H5410_050771 [Solanum commersonii]
MIVKVRRRFLNDVGTIIVPQKLGRRKRSLVASKVIENNVVDFVIIPSKGATNLYTIKLKKNEDKASDSYGLNCKYYDLLHGWKAEKKQRQNGKCETFYFHKSKYSICRSIRDVRIFIFEGIKKLRVDVQPVTNVIIESMVGGVVKKSKKRKGESSILERESAAKKCKRNGQDNQDKSETQKYFDDAWNNLMNMDGIHNNQVTHVKKTIRNCS